MCVWGGRRGPFRACGLQVPAELNSRARPSTRPLGSRAHCFLLVSLGSRLGSILDATGTVHADVMTQTISPCVPCLWTPPPRALAPAGPSVPTEGLTGSARVATVCPLLRVPPPPRLVQSVPAESLQQTWGGGVTHFQENRILGRRGSPSGAPCPSGGSGARQVAGTCRAATTSCHPPSAGSRL